MMFKPELVEQILAGVKTQTRRPMSVNPRSPWWEGGCTLNVEQDYAVCPGRGKPAACRVRVTGIRREHWVDITEADAVAEGFRASWWRHTPKTKAKPTLYGKETAAEAFLEYVHGLYLDLDDDAECWVVEFELIKEAGQ